MPVKVRPGQPHPLGVTLTGDGANVAVYSSVAEQVTLCLFDEDGAETHIPLPGRDAGVWHGRVAGLKAGQAYGFRVDGPWDPRAGLLCNPNKLLLDPYARAISGSASFPPAVYSHDVDDPARPSALDSSGCTPRGVMVGRVQNNHPIDADDDGWQRPRRHISDSVIYELHVKGFTARHPDIPAALRGTYAGLAHPVAVDYLKRLGITAVELLPVHHNVPEAFLVERGLTNYWGYNTIGFFAPYSGYSAAVRAGNPGGQVEEFAAMVRALHAADIEVLLDVVYNHTAEAGPDGPSLCFRGLDNAAYYRLDPADPSRYIDTTGCGNSMNVGNAACLRLIMDSLRYWVAEMGVDGFRFDLASTLARQDGGFEDVAAFFDLVWQDPIVSQVKLIAEPWDVGQGDSYDVGRFPAGWSEWNGKFRDTVRDFWRSHDGLIPDLATRLQGSPDLYTRHRRGPDASINLVTVHDGFTLADLVSYNDKHNEANTENNRDGTGDNRSWNCGVEGPTDDPDIRQLRSRQSRAFLSTLLLARGVPLLLGGDEVGRSQRGNNNAYCQDNEIAWWDWSAQDLDLQQFVTELIALRLAHPVLRRRGYPRHPQTQQFFTPAGEPMSDADWRDAGAKSVALVLAGSVDPELDDDGEPMLDDDLAVLVNAWWEPLVFVLPFRDRAAGGADGAADGGATAGAPGGAADGAPDGDRWTVLSDSFEPANRGTVVAAQRVRVGPRSVVLLNRST